MRSCLLRRICLVAGCLVFPWMMVSGCGTSTTTIPNYFGTLTVTIAPESARAAGGRWTMNGRTYDSGHKVTGLWPNAYTVTFQPAEGYQTPASQVVTVYADVDSQIVGEYTPVGPATGAVTVNVTPAGAVTAGAKWTLDGGATQYSPGASVANVAPGNHTVAFTSVSGYTTPANQTVTVTANATATADAVYTAIPATTGTIRVICEPAGVRDAGAQWAIDGGTFHDSGESVTVEPGSHEISYKYISGWYRPATLTIDVVAGQVYERTITYSVAVGRTDDPRRR